MHGLDTLALGFHAAAAVAALGMARRHREQRPVALFLALTLAADVGAWGIRLGYLDPARATLRAAGVDPLVTPWTGSARVAFHAFQGLWLIWAASIAGLALVTLGRRRAWPAAVGWAAALGALVVTYPVTRGALLQRCYLGGELIALAVGARYGLEWFARLASRRAPAPSRPAIIAGASALVIVAIELCGVAVGAWRGDIFTDWRLSQITYAVEYAVLFALQIGGGFTWDQNKRYSSTP